MASMETEPSYQVSSDNTIDKLLQQGTTFRQTLQNPGVDAGSRCSAATILINLIKEALYQAPQGSTKLAELVQRSSPKYFEIFIASYPLDQNQIDLAMALLAMVYYDLEKYAEVGQLLTPALYAPAGNPGEPERIALLKWWTLSCALGHECKFEEVFMCTYNSWLIAQRLYGPSDPETMMFMYQLATSYSNIDQHEQAVALFPQVLDYYKTHMGPGDSDTLHILSALGNSYVGLERFAEAEKLDKERLGILVDIYGTDHPESLECRIDLVETYYWLKEYTLAWELGFEKFTVVKEKFGVSSDQSRRLRCLLSILYHKINPPEEDDEAMPVVSKRSGS